MPESTYPAKLAELVDLLELQSRADRIDLLIDISKRFQRAPESIARKPYPEETRVPACESEAFVWAVPRHDGSLDYHFAVENPQGISAMAMAVILREHLSGLPAEEVLRVPRDLAYRLFGTELSMGKSMGLMSMLSMVQNYACRHLGRTPPRPGCEPD